MAIINPLPNSIANGQTEDATPLMANFNAIVSNVNANAAAAYGGTLTNPVLNQPTVNGSGGTLTLPNGPDTLVSRTSTDTLTNKTLTSPVINTPTINGSGGALTLPAGPATLLTTAGGNLTGAINATPYTVIVPGAGSNNIQGINSDKIWLNGPAVSITDWGTAGGYVVNGSVRQFMCNAAHIFPGSANMQSPAGSSGPYTAAVGDVITWEMDGTYWRFVGIGTVSGLPPAQSVSGSFTATLVGCTTSPTVTATYVKNGNMVTVVIPAMTATSNSTSLQITGLPAAITPAVGAGEGETCVRVWNNSAVQYSGGTVRAQSSGTMQLTLNSSDTGFTASGVKGVGNLSFTYKLV